MTVQELIKELQEQDPNRIVILQRDGEGNGFSPLSCAWAGIYRAETPWHGEIGLETLTESDKENGFSELDLIVGVPALILRPIA